MIGGIPHFLIHMLLLATILIANNLPAHGYSFKYARDEMKDDIRIDISNGQMTILYNSVYIGQLAPHARNMIDTDSDSLLTAAEIEAFFTEYKQSLNRLLKQIPVQIGDRKFVVQLADVFWATLLTDSLFAPFRVGMLFVVPDFILTTGDHELIIDPRLFFINGDHLIQLAKQRVAFTDQQEQAIGRYLQIRIFASPDVRLLSTFPGRIKKKDREAFIYGVFYDLSILQVQEGKAPPFRIRFRVTEEGQ